MARLILKKSSVLENGAPKVPAPGDLEYGELAINYAVGTLYYKKSDNTIGAIGAGAAPGNGTLSLEAQAGLTNTSVSIGTGTGFSANTATNTTYQVNVGPALSALAGTMTGAGTGFLRKSGADTYTLDTNTYVTATGEGASGSWSISITGSANTANTATSAGSVSNSIIFNTTGGGPAGTTYNGSQIQQVDYSTVGAAPAIHSHDYLPLAGGTMTGVISMSGTQTLIHAGFAGIEYYNTAGTWEVYIGTENNTGNVRYNSRQGTHTWYANGTSIGSLTSAGLNVAGTLTLGNSGANTTITTVSNSDLRIRPGIGTETVGRSVFINGSNSHSVGFGGKGGNVEIRGGTGLGTISPGGDIKLEAGTGTTSGGNLYLWAANGGESTATGASFLGGGEVDIRAGNTGTIGQVRGGQITLTAGLARGTNIEGAPVTIYTGRGTGTGGGGKISFYYAPAGVSGTTANNWAEGVSLDKTGMWKVYANSASTSTTTGALVVAGGTGIGGNLHVAGTITHAGLSPSVGTGIDQIYTHQQNITLTTEWQDTGVNAAELATGSYIVQITSVNDFTVGGGHYDEYYTGIMSWFADNTNDTQVDDIMLHRAGHAPNEGLLYLRTQRTVSADTNNLKLQIAGTTTNNGPYQYTFKFRRLI